MKKDNSRGLGRTRNWTFILYPESAPENWRQIIDDEHIQWIESPLHDIDTDATGELKKAHWHILLMYESVKSYEQIKVFTDKLNAPNPQRANGAKALVRYFAHIDNPEKAQYSVNDIKGYGGVDIAELLRPSSSERYSLIKEMLEYCKINAITEFQDLFDFAMSERFDDWFPLLCDNSAYVVGQYIKSQRYRLDNINTKINEKSQ